MATTHLYQGIIYEMTFLEPLRKILLELYLPLRLHLLNAFESASKAALTCSVTGMLIVVHRFRFKCRIVTGVTAWATASRQQLSLANVPPPPINFNEFPVKNKRPYHLPLPHLHNHLYLHRNIVR